MDRAKAYGIPFGLTLEQYMQMAQEAGIGVERIGRRKGEYCVGRFGDAGGYFVGNCRFITVEQNHQEKVLNGGQARANLKNRGRVNDKVSSNLSGRSKETHSHIAVTAESNSKSFKVVSPSGVIHEGKNLNQFCKEQGLFQSPMSALCRGVIRSYKGWTGEYVDGCK